MPLTDVITSSISAALAAPTQPGFGVPLILGVCQNALAAFGATLIRYYTGTAAMLTDGFLATDPEYLYAAEIFSQNPTLPQIAIGRRTNLPTQQFKITVLTSGAVRTYTVTVNGVAKSYTCLVGDSTSVIATALAAAIGTPTGFGAASAAGAIITITASAAGNWARISATNPNVDLDCWQSQADAGAQTDLTNIANVDSTWYAILSTFTGTVGATNASETGQIAAWTEANGKFFLADVQESLALNSGTADLAAKLKTLSYTRTATLYHPDNGAAACAAWAGARLVYAPGSETWKFATLSGVPAVVLTATQQTNLEGKNCNYYYSVAGVGMTTQGVTATGGAVASGYIDYVRGKDWLTSRIQNRIFTVLTTPTVTVNPATGVGTVLAKTPFTDQGIAAMAGELRAALQEGVDAGLIAASPPPIVNVPKASAVTPTNKANRLLTPITWSGVTASAIHKVAITGVLQ